MSKSLVRKRLRRPPLHKAARWLFIVFVCLCLANVLLRSRFSSSLKVNLASNGGLSQTRFSQLLDTTAAVWSNKSGRRLSPNFTEDNSNNSSSNNNKVAALTKRGRGLDHDVNQDRAIIVSPYYLLDDATSNNILVGVFDGHGVDGDLMAAFAAQNLPKVLSQELEQQQRPWTAQQVTESLTTTFRWIHKHGPPLQEGGSTASVALRLENSLYLASVGDSVSFVATYDNQHGARVIHVSRRHKPNDRDERARIEQHGGTVKDPEAGTDESARVRIVGQNQHASYLSMSRSLGDRDANSVGVIPDPTVRKIDLSELKGQNSFVVSVTDGLFDMVSLQDIANELAPRIFSPVEPIHSLRTGCKHLLHRASSEWSKLSPIDDPYRDDITIAVHRL